VAFLTVSNFLLLGIRATAGFTTVVFVVWCPTAISFLEKIEDEWHIWLPKCNYCKISGDLCGDINLYHLLS